MSTLSFSELNKRLKEKLEYVELFQGKHFNYSKIVQHALTYAENNVTSKNTKNNLHWPVFLQVLIYRLKLLLRKKSFEKPCFNETIIIDNGRYSIDEKGAIHSKYFEKISQLVKTEFKTTLLNGNSDIPCDFNIKGLKSAMGIPPLIQSSIDILKDVSYVFKEIASSGMLTPKELSYISSQFHVFLDSFFFYNFLFHKQTSKTAFLTVHYHNEGMIAAFKLNGIKCIELQHGLIAENDLYYVYPSYMEAIADKSLFADLIFVFGEYWKNLLLKGFGYTREQIIVIGDYSYSQKENISIIDKKNVILITSQKNMAEPYIKLISILSERLISDYKDWSIEVKLHPLEKEKEKYTIFEKKENVTILGNDSNLNELFQHSKIHISIYSTTFYDAIGFDILNLSVQNFSTSSDYARDMIKENIAYPMEIEEDPIEIFNRVNMADAHLQNRHNLYSPFDKESILKLIANK